MIAELQYPTHKIKLYKRGGVSNSHKLVRGIQMKKGSQQMTKIPITIPRVTAALKVKKLCEIDYDQWNERMNINVVIHSASTIYMYF